MQQIKDLVPLLDGVKELYRAKEFQPLAQFLHDLGMDVYRELLSLDSSVINPNVDKQIKVAVLIAQLNLLGTIKDLPQIILKAKQDIEAHEAQLAKLKQSQED